LGNNLTSFLSGLFGGKDAANVDATKIFDQFQQQLQSAAPEAKKILSSAQNTLGQQIENAIPQMQKLLAKDKEVANLLTQLQTKSGDLGAEGKKLLDQAQGVLSTQTKQAEQFLNNYVPQVQKALGDFQTQATGFIDQLKTKGTGLIGDAKKEFDQVQQQSQQVLEDAKKQLEQVQQQGQQVLDQARQELEKQKSQNAGFMCSWFSVGCPTSGTGSSSRAMGSDRAVTNGDGSFGAGLGIGIAAGTVVGLVVLAVVVIVIVRRNKRRDMAGETYSALHSQPPTPQSNRIPRNRTRPSRESGAAAYV